MGHRLLMVVLALMAAGGAGAIGYFLGRGPMGGDETGPNTADTTIVERPIRSPGRNLGAFGGADRARAAEMEPSAVPEEMPRLSMDEALAGLRRPETAVHAARSLLSIVPGEGAPGADAARKTLEAASQPWLPPEDRGRMVADALNVLKAHSQEEFAEEAASRLRGSPAEVKRAVVLTLTAGVRRDVAFRMLTEALGDPDVADLAHRILVMQYGRGHDLGKVPEAWRARWNETTAEVTIESR